MSADPQVNHSAVQVNSEREAQRHVETCCRSLENGMSKHTQTRAIRQRIFPEPFRLSFELIGLTKENPWVEYPGALLRINQAKSNLA